MVQPVMILLSSHSDDEDLDLTLNSLIIVILKEVVDVAGHMVCTKSLFSHLV